MSYKFGKTPHRHDPRDLPYKRYKGSLPAYKLPIGHWTLIPEDGWYELGNTKYGC